MAFHGLSFIFDGIPSEEFGLMLYDFETNEQGNGTIGSTIKINEDRLWGRATPIDYGSSENEPMEFDLVMSVDTSDTYLDRFDIAKIAGWLKKPDYRYLQICQMDLEQVRYRCRIVSLEPVNYGLRTMGLVAKVVCDGPYAYLMPYDDTFVCATSSTTLYRNRSNVNRYYYPKITLTTGGGDITIRNRADEKHTLKFTGLPNKQMTIDLDPANGIVAASDGTNLYDYFNFVFPRFIRGDNELVLMGNFTMVIHNEFPYDIGC